jgi:ribonuclease P protein component
VAGFSKSLRLLTAADFKRVFDSPDRRSVDGKFTLLARKNGLDHARIGMAITKKRLKKAVDRNLAKRIIRESFRAHQATLTGYDIVVLNRNGVMNAENRDLFRSLETHWSRLVSRCKKS